VTREAAASLGVWGDEVATPRGALVPGGHADLVVWDLPHEAAILQPWGVSKTWAVLRDGVRIGGAS
jgi:imidazolonepropionase